MSSTALKAGLGAAVAFIAAVVAPTATAGENARTALVDARYKPLSEVREEYRDALLGDGSERVINRRITVLVSSRRGFDAGYLVPPRNVRVIRSRVDLVVFHGSRIEKTIAVNLWDLDRSRIYQINQSIRVR